MVPHFRLCYRMGLLAMMAAAPTVAAAQPLGMPPDQVKEFAGMLGAATLQAAQTADACKDVPASSEIGDSMVPEEARGFFPAWRGGLDVRWLREQTAVFGRGFAIVVQRLAEGQPEIAEKLLSEFQQAAQSKSMGPSAAEQEKMHAEPQFMAAYCAGLRGMVEEMGVLLTAVPRDGGKPDR